MFEVTLHLSWRNSFVYTCFVGCSDFWTTKVVEKRIEELAGFLEFCWVSLKHLCLWCTPCFHSLDNESLFEWLQNKTIKAKETLFATELLKTIPRKNNIAVPIEESWIQRCSKIMKLHCRQVIFGVRKSQKLTKMEIFEKQTILRFLDCSCTFWLKGIMCIESSLYPVLSSSKFAFVLHHEKV